MLKHHGRCFLSPNFFKHLRLSISNPLDAILPSTFPMREYLAALFDSRKPSRLGTYGWLSLGSLDHRKQARKTVEAGEESFITFKTIEKQLAHWKEGKLQPINFKDAFGAQDVQSDNACSSVMLGCLILYIEPNKSSGLLSLGDTHT